MERRSKFLCLIVLLLLVSPARGQQKMLTVDLLYDPERKVNFDGYVPTTRWLKDGNSYLEIRTDPRTELSEWHRVDVQGGSRSPFYDPSRLEAALARVPGVTAEKARELSRQATYELSPDENALLITVADDVYVFRIGEDRLLRVTNTPGKEELARFSPDGRLVSVVRDNNLYMVDIETRDERALTTDGGPRLLNGILDWVYQEEIYGRGDYKAYWWSPDSRWIAFLQLDESRVPDFTVVDHIPYRLALEVYPYPKAGDANPQVRLGVVPATGGSIRWVDLYKYQNSDFLIVRVGWRPASDQVVYQVQNREQTWLDLNLADPETGASRTLLRETSKAWVNENGAPHWLEDGSFLWFSERTGWKHLYHYREDGSLIRPLSSGPWEARTLDGVDSKAGTIYLTGTERSPIGEDVYRLKMDGSGLTRLSGEPGTHEVQFNSTLTHYTDTWSDITTPSRVHLCRSDGALVRTIERNEVQSLSEYRLSRPELLQVKTRDGFVMEAFLLKPPDFDPTRKYPVWVHVYGGPHAPRIANQWGGTTYMWHQMLAQKGFIIWICDNRIASGKGAQSTWNVYRKFGEIELRDLEDSLDWLKSQPWVDGSRIGLWGWSFGGFMTGYAMTHSKTFKVGIAGGSVTDWRDYDSIYTERYMSTPQQNPEGYEKSSVVRAAKDLHGKILLIHGTMDDNVHLQNTLQLAYELQKAGKGFELMLYPKSRHGVQDPFLLKHLRTLMTDFIVENLGDSASPR